MLIRAALKTLLATAVVAAQPSAGEISGRITMNDEQRSALPFVGVTVSIDGRSQQVFTDNSGQFVLRSVGLGTHRVVLELAGFRRVSGDITLSPSVPTAFLAWSMEVGCLSDEDYVVYDLRTAARKVSSIVHLRVAAETGPVLVSEYPECVGKQRHGFAVQVASSVGRVVDGRVGRSQILANRGDLATGREYVALLWPDATRSPEYLLPVVAGRVVAPMEAELNGKRLHEALDLLQRWAQEKER